MIETDDLRALISELERERDEAESECARLNEAFDHRDRERSRLLQERDEARFVARQILPLCTGRDGFADLLARYPWLCEVSR